MRLLQSLGDIWVLWLGDASLDTDHEPYHSLQQSIMHACLPTHLHLYLYIVLKMKIKVKFIVCLCGVGESSLCIVEFELIAIHLIK